MQLIINIDDGKKNSKKKTIDFSCKPIDMIAIYDDGCLGWTRDHRSNEIFLKSQQNYANDLLKARGHLFLNDVLSMLGMPPRKIGQIVGWVYKEGSYVDFGLDSKLNKRFMLGDINVATLEFNVNGEILSKL